MDFEYRIHPDQRLVVMRYEGAISLADAVENSQLLWSDPDYNPTFMVYCDLTAAVAFGEPRDIPTLRRFLKADGRQSQGKQAVVVNNPTLTALAMIYMASLPPTEPFRIFSAQSAALEFLGIESLPE